MNTNPYQAPARPVKKVKIVPVPFRSSSINGAAVACAFLLLWAGLVYLTFSGVR